MAQTFTGRKRVRKFFGHIREVAVMPNLIEVQKASYDQFLQIEEPKGGRIEEGLQAVFKSVFPISDFSGASLLEFVKFTFEAPKYDVDECRQRGMTYAAPLKVTLRLIVFDIEFFQHRNIFITKRCFLMMLLLTLNIFYNVINIQFLPTTNT